MSGRTFSTLSRVPLQKGGDRAERPSRLCLAGEVVLRPVPSRGDRRRPCVPVDIVPDNSGYDDRNPSQEWFVKYGCPNLGEPGPGLESF